MSKIAFFLAVDPFFSLNKGKHPNFVDKTRPLAPLGFFFPPQFLFREFAWANRKYETAGLAFSNPIFEPAPTISFFIFKEPNFLFPNFPNNWILFFFYPWGLEWEAFFKFLLLTYLRVEGRLNCFFVRIFLQTKTNLFFFLFKKFLDKF